MEFNQKIKTKSIIKYVGIIILSVLVGIEIAYTINYEPIIILEEHEPIMFGDPTNPRIIYEGEPSSRTLLPYAVNHEVPFDYEGRINYDELIKKLLPSMWEEKLNDMEVDVSRQHMVLLRGFQVAMYQESSYQCGYVIDDDKEVYWLEGKIDKSKIYDVEVFTENPMPCKPNHGSCWCIAQTLAEEQLLDFEKTPLTTIEETIVVNFVHDYLKDNTNLNFYKYQVGKYHMDYGDNDIISYCGVFDEKSRNEFFSGTVNKVTNKSDFGMDRKLSPLCIIPEDAKWNSFN